MTSSRTIVRLVIFTLLFTVFSAPVFAYNLKPDIVEALNANDTAQALVLINNEIKTDASYGPNYLIKGQILFARNQLDESLELFELALKKKSKLYEALYYKGKVHLLQKNFDEAEKAFQKGIKKAKKEKALFHNGMGMLLIEREEYAKADVEFRKAIQEDPENVEFYANLGDANYYQKIYALAINEYNRVIEKDTTYLDVYFRLARCYVAMRQFSDALDQLSIVLSRDTLYAYAWKEAGRLYTMAGLSARDQETKKQRFSETIGSYRRFLELTSDSTDGEVFFNIGRAYFNLGGFPQADSALSYVLSLGDTPKNIYLYMGRSKMGIEDFQAGIDYLKQHLAWLNEDKPDRTPGASDADLYRRIADAYRTLEDHANAAENYVLALELKPQDDAMAVKAAISYHQLKDYATALEYYDKRIAIGPDLWSVFMNAGLCAINLEEYERAVEYLQKVVEIEPTKIKAYTLLSSTYMSELSDCQNGLLWTEKLYKLDTTNCDALKTLGFIYSFSDDCTTNYPRAVSYYKKALACFKDKGQEQCGNSDLMKYIAQAYHLQAAELAEANKIDESKKYFKNAYDWYCKVVICDPNDKDAKKGKDDTEFEY